MTSKKNLIRTLNKLITLFDSNANNQTESWKKDAFLEAYKMANVILKYVEIEDYKNAIYQWGLLMRFSDDSISISEDYLSTYTPLKQSLINYGLRGS